MAAGARQPGRSRALRLVLPHRSQTNLSDTWRRSAYLTYNIASEGDLHAAYYQKKLSAFREGVAGDISINKDFGGEIVRGSGHEQDVMKHIRVWCTVRTSTWWNCHYRLDRKPGHFNDIFTRLYLVYSSRVRRLTCRVLSPRETKSNGAG